MGAAIAAGSHLENGIWALLVMAATVRHAATVVLIGKEDEFRIIQWPWLRNRAIEIRRRASPMRFIRAVIIPALRAVGV